MNKSDKKHYVTWVELIDYVKRGFEIKSDSDSNIYYIIDSAQVKIVNKSLMKQFIKSNTWTMIVKGYVK